MSKVVEDYVLMESVGKGQYGNVYKAQHRKTDEMFAVKVMGVDKFKQTPKLSEFTNNEISILTKINHPNIIKFIEMLRTNNNYYLVYEFCNGGTLAEYIRSKKRLSEEESIKIFAQLRSAYELLNREKILHRDLKPTNILFHNGVIKIADFGFCKELINTELTQTMVGSPIYMAPEVLKGSFYDGRADVWSLGVILYEMLYGFCPYEESSISKLIGLINNTLLKFPPEIPISHHLQVLMKRMMTTKYRERISADELVRYPLDAKEKEAPMTPKSSKNINIMNLKEVKMFCRKFLTYLGESLNKVTLKLEQSREAYAPVCFFLFKILSYIQKNTLKSSPYWEFTKNPNHEDEWDTIIKNEMNVLEPFGQNIKEVIMSNGVSISMRMEIESTYIDYKYYMEICEGFETDGETKNIMMNCLLIHRHFVLVIEKKVVDWTDYTESKKSMEEKEDICKKFSYTRT